MMLTIVMTTKNTIAIASSSSMSTYEKSSVSLDCGYSSVL